MTTTLKVRIGERWYTVEVEDLNSSPIKVWVDGEPVEVNAEPLSFPGIVQSLPREAVETSPDIVDSVVPDEVSSVQSIPTHVPQPVKEFRSPMAGIIVSVSVKEGDQVVTGDEICVLEAMKMQQVLRADWSGLVSAVHVGPGHQIKDGDIIVELT